MAFAEIVAPPAWRTVDLISDLHLQASEPATVDAWRGYLDTTPADAVFILGDLFEVWVGDDAATLPGFEAQCAEVLRAASARRPLYFMHGNRDFLLGADFAARCGMTLVADPTVLVLHGERWLLSHGDALCLEDTEYLRFRAQVRAPEWQQALLARPLEERRTLARSVRAQSEDRKRSPDVVWADVDADAARDWLQQAGARTLVHGHTHRPANHDLGQGLRRVVLSDWDAAAHPPRAQLLCLSSAGAQRVDLR
ncbi:UDP-2,3-diacylglucosamine diphosphatase [Variovorax saccharolyticus]|uniref:UDP-2,3-diacylglucosamine diphosphatase n=1 Tax=Variovorax saccharolyticus TaxID=3053516 RepID=UPI0025757398|nr:MULTISPECIES: UDP-2,3-diacylglucosamine diphosphatase [unclassified Variovorax]MDM0016767.1 UDP-2,3-diacylglucosamine diphosphatase [Variovorax sp. J22R187]MDM0023317.1 UDP-2,3-diacylglucosamine diphosphatase [Variovorax sp. J31P216]